MRGLQPSPVMQPSPTHDPIGAILDLPDVPDYSQTLGMNYSQALANSLGSYPQSVGSYPGSYSQTLGGFGLSGHGSPIKSPASLNKTVRFAI